MSRHGPPDSEPGPREALAAAAGDGAEPGPGLRQFCHAMEAAPNGILLAGAGGRIVFANQRARDMFGYGAGEMEGLGVEQLLPERYAAGHAALRRGYAASPVARPMGTGRELFARRRDGSEFPVEIGLSPVDIGGERLVLAMAADITERKRASEALLEQACLLANLHEAVFTLDAGGLVRSWNRGAEVIFGWREEEILGQPAAGLCPAEEPRNCWEHRVWPALEARGRYESIHRFQRKGGELVTVAIRVSSREEPAPPGAIVCANDISRQRELEDEIVQISEKEQRRIGRDLHDDLCQQLASIGCLAKVIQRQVAAGGDADSAEALDQVVEMLSQANTRAREISRGLAPAVIQREGLAGALEELASRTRKVFGVPCRFVCPDPVFIEDEKQAVQIYRIAQEAVANAVKHSDASSVEVRLELLPGQVRLQVSDDGRGFPAKASLSGGLGLHTMAHRARILGGDLDVDSSPGGGTVISCAAPHRNE